MCISDAANAFSDPTASSSESWVDAVYSVVDNLRARLTIMQSQINNLREIIAKPLDDFNSACILSLYKLSTPKGGISGL